MDVHYAWHIIIAPYLNIMILGAKMITMMETECIENMC